MIDWTLGLRCQQCNQVAARLTLTDGGKAGTFVASTREGVYLAPMPAIGALHGGCRGQRDLRKWTFLAFERSYEHPTALTVAIT